MMKSDKPFGPVDQARRHALGALGAVAGRLSLIAASSSLLTNCLIPADLAKNKNGSQQPHCFARGTHILTPGGEVRVEDLVIGDTLVTRDGPRRIKWIGRQSLRKTVEADWHPNVAPVRVARHALDEHTPHRDLYLSPSHALFIDGVLIHVRHLVNEGSIAFACEEYQEEVEYFLVDLGVHSVIFAEGALAETFRYAQGRVVCDNYEEYEAIYGAAREVMMPYAPVCYYSGGRAELAALFRLAVSCVYDVRDPIQVALDRLTRRAAALAA